MAMKYVINGLSIIGLVIFSQNTSGDLNRNDLSEHRVKLFAVYGLFQLMKCVTYWQHSCV
jgi:hypothetical protein